MDSLKVVVDTNVFVKAIFHKNQDAKNLFKLKDVKTTNSQQAHYIPQLGTLLSLSLWQVLEIDHGSKTKFCEDPDDNKFIDCAIDGNVEYIITYDSHLNSLSDFLEENYNIKVLNPYQFLLEYKKLYS